MMGDKIRAKQTMQAAGVPTVPGSDGPVTSDEQARTVADSIGYPVLIKASAGGGGKGMQVAKTREDLHQGLLKARREASAAFGNESLYIEKYLDHPRHIEVQILGDAEGNLIHLGARDCSLQRSHQKLLEEAPSPALNDRQRAEIGDVARRAAAAIGYRNAGTLEFLYQDGQFYFIEMNTRLQVEHPVTEAITGIDIVREQIRIAAGLPLSISQDDVTFRGHAIECRINAEDPQSFIPSPGTVSNYHPPGGPGVRIDSALYAGYRVPPTYDSMVAKLIVHGASRNECLMRLRRALEEFVISGIQTTLPLHIRLVNEADMVNGNYDIHWLERFVSRRT